MFVGEPQMRESVTNEVVAVLMEFICCFPCVLLKHFFETETVTNETLFTSLFYIYHW
jgi:hypothetical protein